MQQTAIDATSRELMKLARRTGLRSKNISVLDKNSRVRPRVKRGGWPLGPAGASSIWSTGPSAAETIGSIDMESDRVIRLQEKGPRWKRVAPERAAMFQPMEVVTWNVWLPELRWRWGRSCGDGKPSRPSMARTGEDVRGGPQIEPSCCCGGESEASGADLVRRDARLRCQFGLCLRR